MVYVAFTHGLVHLQVNVTPVKVKNSLLSRGIAIPPIHRKS